MSGTDAYENEIDYRRYEMLEGEALWEIAQMVVNARKRYHTPWQISEEVDYKLNQLLQPDDRHRRFLETSLGKDYLDVPTRDAIERSYLSEQHQSKETKLSHEADPTAGGHPGALDATGRSRP
jgi:hypothetical protein